MTGYAVKHGLRIYADPKRRKGLCAPNPDGHMHDARDKAWKKFVFKKRQRKWPRRYGKPPVIHRSVELRTASTTNKPNGGYEPLITKLDYEVEPWTHLEDWKRDPEFKGAEEALEALEGWWPQRSRNDERRTGDGLRQTEGTATFHEGVAPALMHYARQDDFMSLAEDRLPVRVDIPIYDS
jgi:hypothetical protein